MLHNYYVYILTNSKNTVLYVGVTNNIQRRIEEHKQGKGSRFTKRYNITKFIYYEIFTDPENAIKREKQIKNHSRKRKEVLITEPNPDWREIYPY